MATVQVLEDGWRNYIIKVNTSTVETGTLLVDVSTLNPPCGRVRLDKAEYDVGVGSSVELLWDATADVSIITFSEGPGQSMYFKDEGGINNNAGAGVTGDVLISKTGTSNATCVLWFVKKEPVYPR